jgi:hypothetical protein
VPRALPVSAEQVFQRVLGVGVTPNNQAHHLFGAHCPGAYFVGLPWLYTWGSGRFSGVARDAEYLAEHIKARIRLSGFERQQAAVNEAAIGS